MPALNRAHLIGRALDSVGSQAVGNIEVVVVDGGSNDGTQEVAATYPFVRLVPAPGSTIFQALNTGIRASRATLLGQLNSDDRLPSGTLAAVLEAERAHPEAMILRGRAAFVETDGDGTVRRLPRLERRVALPLTLSGVAFGSPAINTCFVRADTYRALGLYDEHLKIAADRDWLLRAVLAKVPVHLLDRLVYEYLVHGGSATIAPRAGSEGVYAREHLLMVARLLSGNIAPDARRILVSWHAQEVLRFIRRGSVRDQMGATIAQAFHDSPAWPVHAVRPLLRYAVRRLGWR